MKIWSLSESQFDSVFDIMFEDWQKRVFSHIRDCQGIFKLLKIILVYNIIIANLSILQFWIGDGLLSLKCKGKGYRLVLNETCISVHLSFFTDGGRLPKEEIEQRRRADFVREGACKAKGAHGTNCRETEVHEPPSLQTSLLGFLSFLRCRDPLLVEAKRNMLAHLTESPRVFWLPA